VPQNIFDAHVHLGPPEAMAPIVGERIGVPLTTYSSLTWRELEPFYKQLYSGKTVEGIIAFGFPFQEVNYEIANNYIADLMLEDARVTGFILSNPHDTQSTIAQFEAAKKRGARFRGVKPYYDLLGRSLNNSVEVANTSEFVPDDLLAWMNDENLIMMLHTCSIGMGDPKCQQWTRRAVEKFPNVKIILAHMGRYFHAEQFFDFFKTDVFDHPNLFLETSDAMVTEIYAQMLTRPDWCKRLIFGSDLPYGFFNCAGRDDCDNPSAAYNTYHVIGALKTAFDRSELSDEKQQEIKQDIFLNNVRERLLGDTTSGK
jgi:predicted TIM-barrel fold metal-dependent hydrolase